MRPRPVKTGQTMLIPRIQHNISLAWHETKFANHPTSSPQHPTIHPAQSQTCLQEPQLNVCWPKLKITGSATTSRAKPTMLTTRTSWANTRVKLHSQVHFWCKKVPKILIPKKFWVKNIIKQNEISGPNNFESEIFFWSIMIDLPWPAKFQLDLLWLNLSLITLSWMDLS